MNYPLFWSKRTAHFLISSWSINVEAGNVSLWGRWSLLFIYLNIIWGGGEMGKYICSLLIFKFLCTILNGLSIYMIKIHNTQKNITWGLSQPCSPDTQFPSPGPPVVAVSCTAFQRYSRSVTDGALWRQERQVTCPRSRQSNATARWIPGLWHQFPFYWEGKISWGTAAMKAFFVSRSWCYNQPTCYFPGLFCLYSEISH